jgi:hypothetical protein
MKSGKGNDSSDKRKSRGTTKPEVIMPVPDTLHGMPDGYSVFLSGIKERIAADRIKAVLTANAAMVLMYWDIGQSILERQRREGWGARVIDRLSHDLKTAFPDMTGFSPRNLKYMRTFADAWPGSGNCATDRCTIAVGQQSDPAGKAQRPGDQTLVRPKGTGGRHGQKHAVHAD